MGEVWLTLRQAWADMFEPPWKRPQKGVDKWLHWLSWSVGWVWTLGGLLLGALVAPILLQMVGVANTFFQDWLVIAVAVVCSFIVQTVGWTLAALWGILTPDYDVEGLRGCTSLTVLLREGLRLLIDFLILALIFVLPVLGIAYGISRYFTWVASEQHSLTAAFIGALLIKTLAIPLIKGIVTGALFRWFMKWLRGGKDTKKPD